MSVDLWPEARGTIIGAGTGEGTTVTANASAHTKGSWTTLGTASGPLRRMHLMVQMVTTARYRLDLALGTAGNEQVVVTDLYMDGTILANGAVSTFELPIACADGETIRARLASSTGSNTIRAAIAGYSLCTSSPPVVRTMAALGSFTNTDPSATVTLNGTTYTAWTEIVASTPAELACLIVTPSSVGDTTRTSARYQIEIGIGAAAAEETIATAVMGIRAAGIAMGPRGGTIWGRIAAGHRLAYRVRSHTTGTDSFAVSALGGFV